MAKFIYLAALVLATAGASAQTLNEALSKNDTVAALSLIKAGANVNGTDANGTSPLMDACRWANEATVSFLLRHGANPDAPKSPKGRTPLMIACAYYSGKHICQMLLDHGADPNATAQGGITALMLAAQNAKVDVVELLLKRGANRNAKDARGKSALDYAMDAQIDDYIKTSVKDTKVDKDAVVALLK